MTGNKIIYTTNDSDAIIISEDASIFNSTTKLKVVSNVYEEGIGTLQFNNSITELGSECFLDCSTMTSITIPSTVNMIDNTCFNGCENLVSISVESGNRYFSADNGVLFNLNGTTLVFCPAKKGQYYPERTIYGEGLVLSEQSDENLKATVSTEGTTKILKTTDGVPLATTTVIPAEYYYDTEYTIPDGVEKLENKCFLANSKLQLIIVSKNVLDVGDETFKDCSVLDEIRFYATLPPKIGNHMFDNNPETRKVYIQAKNITKYRNDSSWIELDSSDVSIYPIDTKFHYQIPNAMLAEADAYIDSSNLWHLSRVKTAKIENDKIYLSDYYKE